MIEVSRTYRRAFGAFQVTATVTSSPPFVHAVWTQKPPASIAKDYFEWRDTIVADFYQQTGQHAFAATGPFC